MRRILVVVSAILIFIAIFCTSAQAEELTFEKTKINPGQKIDNLFLFGKDGVIAGNVRDEVVVIDGNLTLTKTARLHDRVFLIGGNLKVEPGAQIREGIYQLNFGEQTWNALLLGLGGVASLELGKLALDVLIVLSCLLYLLIARSIVEKARNYLYDSPAKTGIMGLLVTIGLIIIISALSITVVGIPVAVLLTLLLLLLLPFGFAGLSLIIGQVMLSNSKYSDNTYLQSLVGSVLLVAVFNVPVLGFIWGVIILIFSYGAFAQSVFPQKK